MGRRVSKATSETSVESLQICEYAPANQLMLGGIIVQRATNLFPDELPAGYNYLSTEPVFDPEKHLQLEQPASIQRLTDFGYDEAAAARFASPIAMICPVRILSREGIAALREVVAELCAVAPREPDVHTPRSIFSVTCRSRFVRDLSLNEDIAQFFSEQFQTNLIPHTMLHLQTQMNLNSVELEEKDHGWHHDIAAFAYVLMIHDPAKLEGGNFEYFHGTREDGANWLDTQGGIPKDKVVKPAYPGAGYACFMQGSAITHRGRPAT